MIVLCNSKTEILFTQSSYLEYALKVIRNWDINCILWMAGVDNRRIVLCRKSSPSSTFARYAER